MIPTLALGLTVSTLMNVYSEISFDALESDDYFSPSGVDIHESSLQAVATFRFKCPNKFPDNVPALPFVAPIHKVGCHSAARTYVSVLVHAYSIILTKVHIAIRAHTSKSSKLGINSFSATIVALPFFRLPLLATKLACFTSSLKC